MEPLADLHRHLDGSLRPGTVEDLARRTGVAVPGELRFRPGLGLAGALARFEFTLSLLQETGAVRRVADEMCEDAAADGVTTLEIRFAPQLHGGPIEAVIEAALEGAAGRAGLILCALYGEAPDRALELVTTGARHAGVVGIDLAGGPAAQHSWGMVDYAPAFQRAAELGLGRTAHAGEGRAAAEIRIAIEQLGVQRIGHGTSLLDDPAVLDLVIERGVTIEACPTSNLHTGAIARLQDHPLPRWLTVGVRACICTDNTLLSGVTESEEMARARAIPGMTDQLLRAAVAHGHAAAFARPAAR